MTQTASSKGKFKNGFALFKWELKSCRSTLIVFSILAATFITIVFTLSLVVGYTNAIQDGEIDYSQIQNAMSVFQYISGYMVFVLTAVFTIVYTIRIYSYLHNKRKVDLYGSMPVSRRTFFVSKTVSAYLLSVVPALFFLGIISIITVIMGQPVVTDFAMLYVKLLIGAIACISFYGLLAVCSGTTLNAVLSFIAINAAYPVSTLFIKGAIKAFFYGMPTNQYSTSFVMKALNPLAAYDGTNVIYWLVFTAACLFLGIWLVKKRRAECAQTSFAYHLPCYIVEVLVAFIIGMFVGVLFGSLNVMLYGYLGFIFGFLVGSAPAFIITHLILYKGFTKLWKSAIPIGAMVLTVIALMGVCNYDVFGYNNYVPAEDEIKTAGLVDLGNCYCAQTKGAFGLAQMASDDFDDSTYIKDVRRFHSSAVKVGDRQSNEKFASIWANMLVSNIPSEYMYNSYCVAYRLNNGRLVFRYYDSMLTSGMFGEDYREYNTAAAGRITDTDEYFMNYSSVMNYRADKAKSIEVQASNPNNYAGNNIYIAEGEDVSANQAKADMKKVIEAYRRDVEENGTVFEDKDIEMTMVVWFDTSDSYANASLTEKLMNELNPSNGKADYAPVYKSYKNTVAALKEIGVLNADGTMNHKSGYGKNTNPLIYY